MLDHQSCNFNGDERNAMFKEPILSNMKNQNLSKSLCCCSEIEHVNEINSAIDADRNEKDSK